jgi:hypothetical protein
MRADSTPGFVGYRRLNCGLWVEVCRSPAPTAALAELMRRVPRGDIAVVPVGSRPDGQLRSSDR